MAIVGHTLARPAPPSGQTGRQLARRHQSAWDRLLDGIAEFGRMLEVIAEIERTGPSRRAEVARIWLRELE